MELTSTVRQISVVVIGLATRRDDAGAEHTAGIRSDLTAPGDTPEKVVDTCEKHDRRLGAMTDAVTALSAAVAALRPE